ncbi:MAG: hypothetical protein IT245_07105, partial [Bacteroidia bacterium]|nr:hypothetical protein [Bacteroidia bacterium]
MTMVRGNLLFAENSDSTRAIRFDFLLSANTLINDLGNKPSQTGLFYSSVPFELQATYEKHVFGISYLRNAQNDNLYVNGIKQSNDILRYRFHALYLREFSKRKMLSLQAGGGYFFNQSDTLDV